MEYNFLDNSIDIKNLNLPASEAINKYLLKNNSSEIIKAIEFLKSKDLFLYIHGFLGTGKRQFINYISKFVDKEVITLEYYCKASTVCDDILISFVNAIEKRSISKGISINAKITTLNVKFEQYLNSIKKPFVIILHSIDDISSDNIDLVIDILEQVSKFDNVKIITSTRAMTPQIFGNIKINKKIFLKAFTKEIFKEYIDSFNIEYTETTLNDFYKYTRGYYYYTALTMKIIQATKVSLNEFLTAFAKLDKSFDEFLGITYINLIPNTIRNFFWFLRTVRHGLTINALAVFELYDEFSIEYLKNNLMIFQVEETLFVQDYFQQKIDISIPKKIEIKLHKYIIGIYEKQLKETLQVREILISRQALRTEIEYHQKCIQEIESGITEFSSTKQESLPTQTTHQVKQEINVDDKLQQAIKLFEEQKNTEAIDLFTELENDSDLDIQTQITSKMYLAKIYKTINNYKMSQHYYELVERYYKKNNEVINLNYLYYELTDLYFLMYKNERAIETIKKVIYSVDTPQSLMVSSCTLLGNIYTTTNKLDEAFSYYQKAIASLDENTSDKIKAELYFKYALANDDQGNDKVAYEYYTKCITINNNTEYRSLAYSNLGSCYFDNNNFSDSKNCFKQAYNIDKTNNNYDGIYYNASYLAKIYIKEHSPKALDFLIEAKQCAEFINDDFEILRASIALGDYYYNTVSLNKKALSEYFKSKKIATTLGDTENIHQIEARINDMKYRMQEDVFKDIESKYE